MSAIGSPTNSKMDLRHSVIGGIYLVSISISTSRLHQRPEHFAPVDPLVLILFEVFQRVLRDVSHYRLECERRDGYVVERDVGEELMDGLVSVHTAFKGLTAVDARDKTIDGR